MILSPPPYREKDLTGQPWQKWFASIFAFSNKPTTEGNIVIESSVNGFVLKDTVGHYWQIKITTGGVLTTTDLGTNAP